MNTDITTSASSAVPSAAVTHETRPTLQDWKYQGGFLQLTFQFSGQLRRIIYDVGPMQDTKAYPKLQRIRDHSGASSHSTGMNIRFLMDVFQNSPYG